MLSTLGRAAVRRVVSRHVATSLVPSQLALRAAADQNGLTWLATSFARSCAVRSVATLVPKEKAPKKATTASTKAKTAASKGRKKKKPVKKKAALKKKKKVIKKKELTLEQKDKLEIKALKEKSLYAEEPKRSFPSTAWTVFVSEQLKGSKYDTKAGPTERYAQVGRDYNSLSSSEKSQLKSTAEENSRKNEAVRKAWIETKTIRQIQEANNARNLLKRKFDLPKTPKQKRLIKDERAPKRTVGAFSHYQRARWASGDFASLSASGATKDIAAEWRALSDSEKEPYFALSKASSKRFHEELDALKP